MAAEYKSWPTKKNEKHNYAHNVYITYINIVTEWNRIELRRWKDDIIWFT